MYNRSIRTSTPAALLALLAPLALLPLLVGCVSPVPAPPPLPEADTFLPRAARAVQQRDVTFECDPWKVKLWTVQLGSLRVVAACDGYFGRGFETAGTRMMGALVTPEWTVALMQHDVREPQQPQVRKTVYSTVVHEKATDMRCQLAGANGLHAALEPFGQRAELPARQAALQRVLSTRSFRLAPAGAVCQHAGFMAGPPSP